MRRSVNYVLNCYKFLGRLSGFMSNVAGLITLIAWFILFWYAKSKSDRFSIQISTITSEAEKLDKQIKDSDSFSQLTFERMTQKLDDLKNQVVRLQSQTNDTLGARLEKLESDVAAKAAKFTNENIVLQTKFAIELSKLRILSSDAQTVHGYEFVALSIVDPFPKADSKANLFSKPSSTTEFWIQDEKLQPKQFDGVVLDAWFVPMGNFDLLTAFYDIRAELDNANPSRIKLVVRTGDRVLTRSLPGQVHYIIRPNR